MPRRLSGCASRIGGRIIIVDRKGSTEEIVVAKMGLKEGTMTFNDGTETCSVKAAAVVALK